MGRKKLLTEEEIEQKRDEYNVLVIRENNLLENYVKAPRINRIIIAKQLKFVAAQLFIIQTTLDRYTK